MVTAPSVLPMAAAERSESYASPMATLIGYVPAAASADVAKLSVRSVPLPLMPFSDMTFARTVPTSLVLTEVCACASNAPFVALFSVRTEAS